MKIHRMILSIILFTMCSCAGQGIGDFQQTAADPAVKLFQIFDETPAIKSMFTKIDADAFNAKANEMLNSDPKLSADTYRRLASTFYGSDAAMPLIVRDASSSFASFHDTYMRNPAGLDSMIDVIGNVLDVDAAVMVEALASLESAVADIRNADGRLRFDFFGPGQELADVGTGGIDGLIDSIDFARRLYENAPDMRVPAELLRNTIATALQDPGFDAEASVQKIIDYIERPKTPLDSVEATEKEVADWTAADPDKYALLGYVIDDLYPMIKDPTLADAEGEKNFVVRGRQLLDEQARILGETAARRATRLGGSGSDTTLFTRWFVGALHADLPWYNHLEDVDVFDVDGNDMLKWTRDVVINGLNKALKLGADDGIAASRLKELLWEGASPSNPGHGWTYIPTGGGTQTKFQGLFYVKTPGSAVVDTYDGAVIKMAKTRSIDAVEKPFRAYMHDRLNGNANGVFGDDGDSIGDSAFKRINLTHGGHGAGESILEAVFTNLQLHLMSHYFSPAQKRWALTPQDGTDFFGDSTRCVQSLLGGMAAATRNAIVLDRDGKGPGDVGFRSVPMLAELLYVTAAGAGITDPASAPAELSMGNCLGSMGSPLAGNDSISISVLGFSMDIKALGNDDIFRQGVDGGGWWCYATQNTMPANELLQPGTFRERHGSVRSGGYSVGAWHGRFAASQGDIIGIANSTGQLVTSNWSMSEIALACWEGYGPYTFQGRAPNGSDCKYKNDWYTDWYYINDWDGMCGGRGGNKGPGVGNYGKDGVDRYGRYHVYEKIWRPSNGDGGFADSGWLDSLGNRVTTKGYVRDNASNGAYAVVAADGAHEVVLNCDSREEAIKKNFGWLLNQKKYMFVIPIHAYKPFGALCPIFTADTEIFSISTINCNGIWGVTKARRYGSSISDNAKWGLTGVCSSRAVKWDGSSEGSGDWNYFLDVINEGSSTYRFKGVSFTDGDYCVAMDYKYYVSGWLTGIMSLLVSMTDSIWGCLGDNAVLPPSVGDNFRAFVNMANCDYAAADVLSGGYGAASHDMRKFGKYYDTYFPGQNLAGQWGAGTVKASDLPPVPRVSGVDYPTAFDGNGQPQVWSTHLGSSKGKFEDALGIFVAIVGTIHEDGKTYTDIAGIVQGGIDDVMSLQGTGATAKSRVAFFARDGFRAQMDNLVMTMAGLNESYREAAGTGPAYNAASLVSKLIDHDPMTDTTIAGSRKGLLPSVLGSKYANVNYTKPIKDGIEQCIRSIVRKYLDNGGAFAMSRAYADGGSEPVSLPSYYLGDGVTINPALNWDVPINRLRYFCDNASLTQLERSLDLVKDLSTDSRFIGFVKKTVPALNRYLALKHADDRYRETGTRMSVPEAVADGVFQLELTDSQIDEAVVFLKDFRYADVLRFVKDAKLNDLQKLYDFSIDDWGGTMDQADLQSNLDELNAKLVKYVGANPKAGIIDGIYEVAATATGLPDGISAGDTIYGYGVYVEDAAGDIVDGDKRYRYDDYETWIKANVVGAGGSDFVTATWKGLNAYFEFRHDVGTAFAPYCADYTDKWYRGGIIQCPNIYNGHGYDFRMDWAMDSYNSKLLAFTAADFTTQVPEAVDYGVPGLHTKPHTYSRPKGMIDFLYRWGSGIDLKKELDYYKDRAWHSLYATTATVPDPAQNFASDYTANVRTVISDYTSWLEDNVFHYAYTGADGLEHNESYSALEPAAGAHRHALNNVLEVVSALLDPSSPDYQTQRVFAAWQGFVKAADIEPTALAQVRDAAGSLLWDSSRNEYTLVFTKLASRLPAVLKSFQGRYADMTRLGLLTFAPDGIGTYILETMKPDTIYTSWDITEEVCYLMDQDIFQNGSATDTFWWQAGNLLEDMAIVIDRHAAAGERTAIDYAGAIKDIFR